MTWRLGDRVEVTKPWAVMPSFGYIEHFQTQPTERVYVRYEGQSDDPLVDNYVWADYSWLKPAPISRRAL